MVSQLSGAHRAPLPVPPAWADISFRCCTGPTYSNCGQQVCLLGGFLVWKLHCGPCYIWLVPIWNRSRFLWVSRLPPVVAALKCSKEHSHAAKPTSSTCPSTATWWKGYRERAKDRRYPAVGKTLRPQQRSKCCAILTFKDSLLLGSSNISFSPCSIVCLTVLDAVLPEQLSAQDPIQHEPYFQKVSFKSFFEKKSHKAWII